MSGNGNGGWKNIVITALIAAVISGGGALWVLGVGENSYFQDRKTLIETGIKLSMMIEQMRDEVGGIKIDSAIAVNDIKELKRRVEDLERKF